MIPGILGLLLLIAKITLIILTVTNSLTNSDESIDLIFKIFNTPKNPNFSKSFESIIPDLTAIFMCILTFIEAKNAHDYLKETMRLGFIVLLCTSFFDFTIWNMLYFLCLANWIIFRFLLEYEFNFKKLSFSILILSSVHLMTCLRVFYDAGFYRPLSIFSFEFLNVSLIYIVFLHISKTRNFEGENSVKEGFLQSRESLPNKELVLFIYFAIKVALILWSFIFVNFAGVFVILWLMYTGIEPDIKKCNKVLKFCIVPIMILKYLVLNFTTQRKSFYDFSFILVGTAFISYFTVKLQVLLEKGNISLDICEKTDPNKNASINQPIINTDPSVITFNFSLFMKKAVTQKDPKEEIPNAIPLENNNQEDTSNTLYWYKADFPNTALDKLILIPFKCYYIISIFSVVLFGLISLDLFHAVFIIFIIFFLQSKNNIKKYWDNFNVYLFIAIALKYSIKLIFDVMNINEDNDIIKNSLGLGYSQTEAYYTLFPLMISTLFQSFINNHLKADTEVIFPSNPISAMLKKYKPLLHIFFTYSFCIVLSIVIKTNILNLLRIIFLLATLLIHYINTRRNLNNPTEKVKSCLMILRFYSQTLMFTRYTFLCVVSIFSLEWMNLPSIGFEVYKTQEEIYFYILADFLLSLSFKAMIRLISQKSETKKTEEFVKFIVVKIKAEHFESNNKSITSKIMNEFFSRSYEYKLITEPFCIYYSFCIFTLSAFWQMTIFMVIYLIIIGVMQIIYIYNHKELFKHFNMNARLLECDDYSSYDSEDKKKTYQEVRKWEYRALLWALLTITTVIALIVTYSVQLFNNILIASESDASYIESSYKYQIIITEIHNTIQSCYGYVIILIILVLERLNIQALIPNEVKNIIDGWEESKTEGNADKNSSQKKRDDGMAIVAAGFMSTWKKIQDKKKIDQEIPKSKPDDSNEIVLPALPELTSTKSELSKRRGSTFQQRNRGHTTTRFNQKDEVVKMIEILRPRIKLIQALGENYKEVNYNIESDIDFISSLDLLKSIFEVFMIMLLLILAFYKLKIISVLYMITVLIIIFFKKFDKTNIIAFILIIGVWSQYILIFLSFSIDHLGLDYIYPESQDLYNFFEFSGTEIYSVYFDLLCTLVGFIYFYYLAGRTNQLIELKKLKNQIDENINRNTNRQQEKAKFEVKTEDKTEDKPEAEAEAEAEADAKLEELNFREVLKNFMFKAKVLFYKFSRFSTLIFVMLFITQSTGIIAAIYCCICLLFVLKENQIMLLSSKSSVSNPQQEILIQSHNSFQAEHYKKSNLTPILSQPETMTTLTFHGIQESELKSFTLYLNLFLNILILELACQLFIQMPVGLVTKENDHWFLDFGLIKIWNDETMDSLTNFDRYSSLNFKIYSFAFLLLILRMINSEDFKSSHKNECIIIEESSKKIVKSMEENLNKRLKIETDEHNCIRLRFERKVELLLDKLIAWNEADEKVKRMKFNIKNFKGDLVKEPWENEEEDEDVENKYNLNRNSILSYVNPFLFKKFMKSVSTLSSQQPDFEEKQSDCLKRKINRHNFYTGKKNSNQDFMQFGKRYYLNENWIPYSYSKYPQIFLFAILSNLDVFVYFLLFVNHFMYASLVSLVLPVSALSYGMIQYPRPKTMYFRFILYYESVIIMLKYIFQLDILKEIFAEALNQYKDPFKIGLNLAKNTYSETLFYYTLWDNAVIFSVLILEYYLLRVGLLNETEIDPICNKTANHKKTLSRENLNINSKPGKDLYPYCLMMQLIITLYLFLFYSRMEGNYQDIDQAIRRNKFQGEMVFSVVIMVVIIIIERIAHNRHISDLRAEVRNTFEADNNDNNQKQNNSVHYVVKKFLHFALLIIFNILVFWFFPINSIYKYKNTFSCSDLHDNNTCNNFEINYFLQGFYVICTIYFAITAQQIRLGLPTFTNSTFPSMKKPSRTEYYFFKFYRAVPFLFELRTFIDWTFSKTSLNLFQWLKLEDINARLFLTDYEQQSLKNAEDQKEISIFEKIQYGVCSLFGLLLIILLPLFIYSTSNPFIYKNEVLSTSLSLKIYAGSNQLMLFSTSTAYNPPEYNQTEWDLFGNSSFISGSEKELTQLLEVPSEPDSIWDVTSLKRNKFCKDLSTVTDLSSVGLTIDHTFIRPYPKSSQSSSLKSDYNFDSKEYLDGFIEVLCKQSTNFVVLTDKLEQIIRIPSAGTVVPETVHDISFTSNLVVKLENSSEVYWTVGRTNENNKLKPLKFFVISDEYSPATFSFSIFGFYFSVVYLLGRLIRYITVGSGMNVIMTDMKDPRHLIILCSQIIYNRSKMNLRMEKILYFELLDILRSPESVKYLTGRNSVKLKAD
ncbi:hypothetical protein SteCoe_18374 [Stentor coeruleus]|uniref:Uncharacterized protein n=1 Tax=Stentor coeruleus TaxID=5963 RepID=A0A1R2BWN0_9CILI|nr:hypothetical protein SteCoe_18374 [Stentor coeruleus]